MYRLPAGGGAAVARRWLVLISAGVLALDQLTKWLVVNALAVGGSTPLAGDLLAITHVRNPGVAFGLLEGWSGLIVLVGVIGLAVFGAILVRRPPTWTGIGAASIAGGALGNLTDRVARGWPVHGEVVDFIDVGFWPAFNVADSAIFLGACVVIIAGFREEQADTGEHARALHRG